MAAGTLVIGAGLSGLAAAHELRRRGLPCTLIELRKRAGGSFISERLDGFVLDAGPLAHERDPRDPLPGLPWPEEAFFALQQQEGGRLLYALHEGSEALIRALTPGLPAGALLTRLAVSSLGLVGSGFAICLENGMVLTAPALILAVPAQQAGRPCVTSIMMPSPAFLSAIVARTFPHRCLRRRIRDSPIVTGPQRNRECPPVTCCCNWGCAWCRLMPRRTKSSVNCRPTWAGRPRSGSRAYTTGLAPTVWKCTSRCMRNAWPP